MAVSWFDTAVARDSCNAGPLAVIAPMLHAMGLEQIFDRHLPQRAQQEYPDAKVLTSLLAARLSQPTALVNVAQWARQSGAEFLFGVPADKLNDDRLGRALDHFFQHRYSILGSVAAQVIRDFQVPLDHLHFDPTHITFTGTYESSTPRPDDTPLPPETQQAYFPPAHITHGYVSTKSRIVHMSVTAAVDDFGAIPLFANPVPGNQNGHTAIAEAFHLLEQYLPLPDRLVMISDRGTYSLPHVARLHDADYQVLCSAPWDEFQGLYQRHQDQLNWRQASFLSIEQQRRRDCESSLPREHYDIAILKHQLIHPTSKRPIKARLIFVRSTAGQKVEHDTRQRNIAKIRAGLEKLQRTVARNHKATKLDSIRRRIHELLGTKAAARYFRWDLQPLADEQRAALPAPERDCTRPTHRLVFSLDEQAVADAARYDGLSVLVTTAPYTRSCDSLFSQFKRQCYLENSHHQYKGPLAVAPLFLKKPSRVEALAMLLQVALTAYQLIQREYRRHLPEDAPGREQHMTTERILREFANYPLVLEEVPGGQVVRPTRATVEQQRLLDKLHLVSVEQLLSRHLPPYHPRT
jgi:transposase